MPRLHLYGDVYSSPGLDLRQKQLLMCAFLAEADMHDQLFGHALAVRTGSCPAPAPAPAWAGLSWGRPPPARWGTRLMAAAFLLLLPPSRAQALRFGNEVGGLEEAARIAFVLAPRPSASVQDSALKTLAMVGGGGQALGW